MRVQWKRPLHQRSESKGLATTREYVVVYERNTRLVSLDPQDATVRWDVPVGRSPAIDLAAGPRGRCLVLPQTTGQLLCLHLATGRRLWAADVPRFAGHQVTHADTVLVGGWRGYTSLRAFDLDTGRLRWQAAAPVRTVPRFRSMGGSWWLDPDVRGSGCSTGSTVG